MHGGFFSGGASGGAAAAVTRSSSRWKSGRYYDPNWASAAGTVGGIALVADTAYGCSLWVPEAKAIDRIGVNVTVAGTAAAVGRLSIYAEGADGLPGALLLDAGTVLIDTATGREATVAYTLPAGVVWMVFTPGVACSINSMLLTSGVRAHGAGSLTTGVRDGTITKTGAGTGAAAATFGAITAYQGSVLIIGCRVV